MESKTTTTDESPAVIQELVAETVEQRQEREAREEYLLRAAESHKNRERIFRDNGLLKEGESLPFDEATVNARCCGRR